ncbi:MAG: FeoA family protein [Bacillota bacterium]|nr:FeoA family protein [Bacillota bacterium]
MRNRRRFRHGNPAGGPAPAGVRLADLPEGTAGHVAALVTREPERLQKLMAFGILPGMPITLLQRRPAFVFQVGQTQVAVDERIAADILVTPSPD